MLPLEIFDLRLSLTGELYRPAVFSEVATATKEQLRLEILGMRFGNNRITRECRNFASALQYMTKSELLAELDKVREEVKVAMEDDCFKNRWYDKYAKILEPRERT